jgi:hypothetical protein
MQVYSFDVMKSIWAIGMMANVARRGITGLLVRREYRLTRVSAALYKALI